MILIGFENLAHHSDNINLNIRSIDQNISIIFSHWLFSCLLLFLEKDDVCVFQDVLVLNPGQSMIKYLEGDFCYTIECLEEKDNLTGFHTLNFTMVNCSKECDVVSIRCYKSFCWELMKLKKWQL